MNRRARTLLLHAWLPWSVIAASPPLLHELAGSGAVSVRVGGQDCDDTEGRVLRAAVAGDAQSRERGLSGRLDPLAPDEAMLFVFESPSTDPFWMKDTYIPLSIGFFGDSGWLVAGEEMAVEPDPGNPSALYGPGEPYGAAIEAAPGTFAAGEFFLCVQR